MTPERFVARCLVGGCGWKVDVQPGHETMRAVERQRKTKHAWVKPGRLHRIEAA